MKAEVNLFPLYFFMISNISGLEKHHFHQQNISHFYYRDILRTLLSTTTTSCVHTCAKTLKSCTHVVLEGVGQGRVQCSLFDASYGVNEFFIDADRHELWVYAHIIVSNKTKSSMKSEHPTNEFDSDVIKLNMENNDDFVDGNALIVSDYMVC